MRHHIFLSYSRVNTKLMQRVRDDLRAAGLSVWTDEGIEPGSFSWKEAIESAIRETGILIVLLSPSANDSRWVQREIDYAEAQGKYILPLLIQGDIQDAVPFALAGSQFVDMRRDYQQAMSILLRRCYQYLPTTYMPTLPARPAATTIMSRKVRRKRKRQQIKNLVASSLVLTLAILILLGTLEQRSQATSVDSEPVKRDATVNLIYTRDTLVIHNLIDETVSLESLVFEQDDISFASRNWLTQALTAGRCVQVWDSSFGFFSADDAPADVCDARLAYRATMHTFWKSSSPGAVFTIRRGDEIVAQCPAIHSQSTATIHCAIEL